MRKPSTSKAIGAAAIAALLTTADGTVLAQTAYPDKAIKILVGFPAGSTPDIAARLVGEKLQTAWGKPIVIENMAGAGGNIATAHVVKAEPDGYTILMAGNGSIVINPSLQKTLNYDTVKDLAPISLVTTTPNLLAVANSVPVKTVQELVALARAKPDELTYAHSGVGISQHLAGELFKDMAKVAVRPVAFRGGPAIMTDLMEGRVSLCFCNIAAVLPLSKDGKLRVLAITSLTRAPQTPEVPTMVEAGFSGFDVIAWFGLMAPAGTPKAIIDKLHAESVKALAAQDLRQKFNDQGLIPVGNSPAEFAAQIKSEIPYWAKLIDAIGLKL